MSAPARLAAVRLVAFDVDGVLTDGRLHYDDHGTTAHAFHVRDGYAFVLAQRAGLQLAAISGRRCAQVARRLRDLRVRHIHQGVDDKDACLRALCARLGIPPAEAAFLGDDINDLPAFGVAGTFACPADADPDVVSWVRGHDGWVLSVPGGHGAAREVIEAVLRAQGRWPVGGTAS